MKVKVQTFDAKAKAADVELNDEVFGLDGAALFALAVHEHILAAHAEAERGTG